MLKAILKAILDGIGPGCDPAPGMPRPVKPRPFDDADCMTYVGAEGWNVGDWQMREHERPLVAELGSTHPELCGGGQLIAAKHGLAAHFMEVDADEEHVFLLPDGLSSQAAAYAFIESMFGTSPFDATPESLAHLGFLRI